MIHHMKRAAILFAWKHQRQKLWSIARERDVSQDEAIAVLLIEGVPFREIRNRERWAKKQSAKIRTQRLATLLLNQGCNVGQA